MSALTATIMATLSFAFCYCSPGQIFYVCDAEDGRNCNPCCESPHGALCNPYITASIVLSVFFSIIHVYPQYIPYIAAIYPLPHFQCYDLLLRAGMAGARIQTVDVAVIPSPIIVNPPKPPRHPPTPRP